MKDIEALLELARHHIGGGVNCTTHEYHALDNLERAVSLMLARMQENERATRQASNVASCLANGILPD